MSVFAVRIEHPFDVAVQRPLHPDARVHHEVPALGGADEATDCGLPLIELLIGLQRLVDVNASIQQGDELATAGATVSVRRTVVSNRAAVIGDAITKMYLRMCDMVHLRSAAGILP